jgi:hypothetical protein
VLFLGPPGGLAPDLWASVRRQPHGRRPTGRAFFAAVGGPVNRRRPVPASALTSVRTMNTAPWARPSAGTSVRLANQGGRARRRPPTCVHRANRGRRARESTPTCVHQANRGRRARRSARACVRWAYRGRRARRNRAGSVRGGLRRFRDLLSLGALGPRGGRRAPGGRRTRGRGRSCPARWSRRGRRPDRSRTSAGRRPPGPVLPG